MDQLQAIRDTVRNIIWSLLLQGVAFILLAILIVLYPALLVALVAIMFVVIGAVLIVTAIKIKTFWDKMPKFLK